MDNIEGETVYSYQSEKKLALCDGCLSSDRLLAPVGKLQDLFFRILNHDNKDGILGLSNLWQSEPHLCWACRKVLLNALSLQQRVYEAQKFLLLARPTDGCSLLSIQCDSLSTLKGCIKQSIDYHFVFDDNDEILIKDEKYMLIDDNATDEPEVYFDNVKNDECYVDVKNYDIIDNSVDKVTQKAKKPQLGRKRKEVTRKRGVQRVRNAGNDDDDSRNDNDESENDDVIENSDDQVSQQAKLQRVIKKQKLSRKNDATRVKSVENYNDDFKNEDDVGNSDDAATKPKRGRKKMKENVKSKPRTKYISAQPPTDRSVYSIIPIDKEEYDRMMLIKKDSLSYKSSEFTCDLCAVVFRRKHKVHKHNKDFHDPNHTFDCDVCPVKCSSDASLKKHQTRHVYYKCNMCDCRFSFLKNFHKHFTNGHAKSFKCSDCGMEFSNKSDLSSHARAQHGGYECAHCGRVSRQKPLLARHIKLHHMPVKCKVCAVVANNALSYRRHYRRHHKQTTGDPVYCVECDVKFNTGQLYSRHLKYHHGFRYDCKKCSKSFKLKSLLREHHDYHHERNYKYICQECDKHFLRKNILDRHIMRMHRNIRPDLPRKHVCELCSRAFVGRQDLVHHVRTHTGARPHACALCAARFAQESPLVTHLRGVHGKVGGFRELLNQYKQACTED